jgi:hypothetical protein
MSFKDPRPISDIGTAEIATDMYQKTVSSSLLPYLINRNMPKAEAYTGKIPVHFGSRK